MFQGRPPVPAVKIARHARLFELIRQQNLTAEPFVPRVRQSTSLVASDDVELRVTRLKESAMRSLLRSS